MRVIIQETKRRYTIPLPFFMLHIAGWIICRKWFWRRMNKKSKDINFPIPLLDKKSIQPILSSLKEYKGLTLVDIKDKNGNGVIIRL